MEAQLHWIVEALELARKVFPIRERTPSSGPMERSPSLDQDEREKIIDDFVLEKSLMVMRNIKGNVSVSKPRDIELIEVYC